MTPGAAGSAEEFSAFVRQHGRGLDRLAYLMLGDEQAAEDLAAEVLLAVWRQWNRVKETDYPVAYVRRIMVNHASAHFRRNAKERRGLAHLMVLMSRQAQQPDSAAVVDTRAALLRLPPRRRACLVLRYAFDLTEREVAETLGISVGTVKSQTSKAVAQFRREIGDIVPGSLGEGLPAKPASTTQRRDHVG
jgi:RNA polymerase sigma-70 factor (sigma-E family)